jgi:hypothetical protein
LSAILIISIFLLVAASLSILRSKRSPSFGEAERLPPEPQYKGLFAESEADRKAAAAEAAREAARALRAGLLARAAAGDPSALADAHAAGDAALYREILDTLAARAGAEDGHLLRALSSLIARSDQLRSSPALAARLLEVWAGDPSGSSAPELLRVAALSDDAATFQAAAETIFRAWAEGRLRGLDAAALDALFEGEYWLLSSDARRSGTGFVLKRTLAELRRGLKESARRDQLPPSDEADREKASH